MKYLLLCVCLFFTSNALAQRANHLINDTPVAKESPGYECTGDKAYPFTEDARHNPVYTYVQQMPQTGFDLDRYLAEHLHYPDSARENNVEGRVVVKFIVNEDGRRTDYRVIKGIGSGCDEEAVRLIKGMPPWLPGRQDGKPVKVWYTLWVMFRLD